MAERRHRDVARLALADLYDQEVLACLDDLEKIRGKTIATETVGWLHSTASSLSLRIETRLPPSSARLFFAFRTSVLRNEPPSTWSQMNCWR